jgi:hypothetical protein
MTMSNTVKTKVSEELQDCEIAGVTALIGKRLMNPKDWINLHGSGTLKKNKRIFPGMVWKSQYLEERTCWDFGWEFECVPRSRLTFGDAITEGHNHSVTEWHIERYMERNANCVILGDKVQRKYIHVEYPDGTKKEGLGIVVISTTAKFIPNDHVVFAIIAEFDVEKDEWLPAVNP